MACRNLGEADLVCQLGDPELMVGHPVGMHQHNGDRADAVIEGRLQARPQIVQIERRKDGILRIDAFHHLLDTFIQHLGKRDLAVEQARPRLIGDPKLVAKPLGDDKKRPVALTFQQRVGGNGGSHLNGVDFGLGDRIACRKAEKIADSLKRGILIGLGVFGQKLVRVERAVRTAADNVGKGTATVDPELPPARFRHHAVHVMPACLSNFSLPLR